MTRRRGRHGPHHSGPAQVEAAEAAEAVPAEAVPAETVPAFAGELASLETLADAVPDLAAPGPLGPAGRIAAALETSERKPACTLAQLRRFIKSRPYVPLHELRRRFAIEGYEDDVSWFHTDGGPVYVGLPAEEAGLLGELVRAGEVGYEQLLDPVSPAVIGVFPMRPVARG